ncbi:MAG: methylenetetrahydromethanopterin dehydrogenase [Alphaproteobacteria bacterium]|nr:methylenetetrahydromethanopterin dehydrogenase [Alphaproteobacteria bacterium]
MSKINNITAILHYLTPLKNPSAFDLNMAIDAGFQIASYTAVELAEVRSFTQDAMFSRPPDHAKRSCIFIGGREVGLAMEMLATARDARLEPFVVSIMADPNGAFTTAAALIAVAEEQLRRLATPLAQSKIAIFGAKGGVGFIAGLIAAKQGARVTLVAHNPESRTILAERIAFFREKFPAVFGSVEPAVALAADDGAKAEIMGDHMGLISAGPAGVELIAPGLLQAARGLRLVLDVNAVPPLGVAGLGLFDLGVRLASNPEVLGVGALAIGNVKYQCQQRMLRNLATGDQPEVYDFHQAFVIAQALVAEESRRDSLTGIATSVMDSVE